MLSPRPRSGPRLIHLAWVAALIGSPAVAAEQPERPQVEARMAGVWLLDPELSQDWAAKIDQSAGPRQIRGGGGKDHLLPAGGGEGEVRRLALRDRLVAASEAVKTIEIEIEPREFRVITLDDDVRIFYLDRKHVRQRADGIKIEVESVWDGTSLKLLEKSGDGTSFSETYTYEAESDRLALLLVVTNDLLREPFSVRSVFVRASGN